MARLLRDRLDPHRILADGQRTQFVDRVRQRAGQRPAEIADADALDALIGLYPKRHDRPLAARIVGSAGERLVGRQLDELGAGTGYFPGVTPADGAGAPTVPSANSS